MIEAAPPTPTGPASHHAPSLRMKADCQLDYQLDGDSEFVFLIHAAQDLNQTLVEEQLHLEPAIPYRVYDDGASGNRFMRLSAPAGPLRVRYQAVVDRVVVRPDPQAGEAPIHELPDEVLHCLLPTRYCESDVLGPVAQQMFGALPRGHSRVRAIRDWVHDHIDYRIGSTSATTTAQDVFVQRSGVCRDFAHLAVTFCRALNIPARLVSAYAQFEDPPPDFHAIFEAYLGGRWVLFDPTGMVCLDQVMRLGTGRDAKDVAFATIYGPARMVAMSPELSCLNPPGASAPAPAPNPDPAAGHAPGAPVAPQPHALPV